MCWVGIGHSQTRPGAFVIKISVATHSRVWAVQIKVCTENVMWASNWTVFCPYATQLRIRFISHRETVGVYMN